MKVRRGRTPPLPFSLWQTTEEVGQMASTMWVEESGAEDTSVIKEREDIYGTLLVRVASYRRGCRQS